METQADKTGSKLALIAVFFGLVLSACSKSKETSNVEVEPEPEKPIASDIPQRDLISTSTGEPPANTATVTRRAETTAQEDLPSAYTDFESVRQDEIANPDSERNRAVIATLIEKRKSRAHRTAETDQETEDTEPTE